MIDLKGKNAIITGSARGIGKATALKLAQAGANVVIADLNEEASKATAAEIAKATGVKAIGVSCNVSSSESAAATVQACVEAFGSVDVLVNNAGITKDTLLMRMKQEQWDAVIAVNLTGTFNCTQAAIKYMMKNPNGGSIINLSSIAGVNGNIGQTNYSASKAGVIGFTKAVALEMASRKVRCNAIAPGFIATEMTEAIPEKIRTAMVAAIPLKRAGQPDDIANTIAFLASDLASFITGQVIEVNGGGFLPGVQA
ncbi:beta-ketoacyl-ACP reductase [Leptospira perolatii]|uniref:3-oxoacyl-[acyl-carrier-protein] reductase n=1 Tax=Leptospira perolatii TaxID=2023191 RepID=A0A2M9ZNI9_9LEPT|nr:3-oxoacyl-[acyl-carrier-protein] reductase [Leptospira perolatii]PJZ68667.1 beta-ketoacyl-ACP reductase [Leptospira perolatii]PJZ73503.1 beta-ketoacyl-ACP reductase [Leptospira perolatii]